MKKVHQASRKGSKWVRKTKWQLDVEDYVGIAVFLLIGGYVLIRSLIG